MGDLITLEIASGWTRGGTIAIEEYLVPGESFICLTDFRLEVAAGSFPVTPIAEQVFPEDDFLMWNGEFPFNNHHSLIDG